MKELKMVKKLFALVISIGLMFALTSFVYAADDDPFIEITPQNTTPQSSNEIANTTPASTDNNTANSLFDNTTTNNTNTNTNTNTNSNNSVSNGLITTNNTLTNNSVNRSVSNTETLAKTGIGDSKGMIAVFVVICGISAVYSYKKVNDYKKL